MIRAPRADSAGRLEEEATTRRVNPILVDKARITEWEWSEWSVGGGAGEYGQGHLTGIGAGAGPERAAERPGKPAHFLGRLPYSPYFRQLSAHAFHPSLCRLLPFRPSFRPGLDRDRARRRGAGGLLGFHPLGIP